MSAIPRSVIAVIDFRDSQKCVRCGAWLAERGSRHHRQRRQVGGHLVCNVILLCGSGTTGCHGWVHSNAAQARREGLIVRVDVRDVAEVPVRILNQFGRFEYVRLTVDGQRESVNEADALEYLALVA